MALEEGTDNLMRRVTDVDTNIDIGQGLHVGSVANRDGSVLEKTGPGPVLRSVFTVFGP